MVWWRSVAGIEEAGDGETSPAQGEGPLSRQHLPPAIVPAPGAPPRLALAPGADALRAVALGAAVGDLHGVWTPLRRRRCPARARPLPAAAGGRAGVGDGAGQRHDLARGDPLAGTDHGV